MVNNLASMYEEMGAEGITVVECRMKNHSSVCVEQGRMIGVDLRRFDCEAELCAALIHEEGHFLSGAFYVPYSPYQVKAQFEERAKRAAFRKRIPLNELKELTRKDLPTWEIAEHFNVTVDCIWEAFQFYEEALGAKFG